MKIKNHQKFLSVIEESLTTGGEVILSGEQIRNIEFKPLEKILLSSTKLSSTKDVASLTMTLSPLREIYKIPVFIRVYKGDIYANIVFLTDEAKKLLLEYCRTHKEEKGGL